MRSSGLEIAQRELEGNLNTFIPKIDDSKISKLLNQVNQVRSHLLYCQRITTVLPLFKSDFVKNYYDQLCSDLIYTQPVDAFPHITPTQVQFITNFISYVHNNPHLIVKALNLLFNSSNHKAEDSQKILYLKQFFFICYSALPSIFGFFSTKEHLTMAFNFYCSMIEFSENSISVVEHSLIPFFCNSSTSIFIDAVFNDFCLPLFYDRRFSKNSAVQPPRKLTILKTEYMPVFLQVIKNKYELLPHVHQLLLKYLKIYGWTDKNLLLFFINHFLFSQVMRRVHSSQFVYFDSSLKLFNEEIIKDTSIDFFGSLIELILKPNSAFELKSGYIPFDLSYIHVLTTTLDIKTLLTALISIDPTHKIPLTATQFLSSSSIQKSNYTPFFIKFFFNHTSLYKKDNLTPFFKIDSAFPSQIFPKDVSSKTGINHADYNYFYRNVFDKSTKNDKVRSEKFETFLSYKLSLQQLEYLDSIFQDHFLLSITSYFRQLIQEKLQNYKNPISLQDIPIISESVLNKINSPRLFRFVCMVLIESDIASSIELSAFHQFEEFESSWNDHITPIQIESQEVINKAFLDRFSFNKIIILNQQLWSIIEKMQQIQNAPFEWTLEILFETLNDINIVLDYIGLEFENEVLLFVTAFGNSKHFFSRFLLIHIYLEKCKMMNSPVLRSEDEILSWSRMQKAIMLILGRNKDLFREFLSIQAKYIC